jgi:ABC-type multidrug transport system fused ATPase/permease subunit
MFLSKHALRRSLQLLNVDFTKPWWYMIVQQKGLVTAIISSVILAHIFWNVSPFLVAYAFESGSASIYGALFICWFLVDCVYTFAGQLNTRFQLQCIHSIYQSAHQYLLTVDPRYHVYRSSGTILGKIERAARGYEDLLDQITFEFIPLIVGIVSTIVALSFYTTTLAYVISFFFIGMVIGSYYFAVRAGRFWEQGFIVTDDAFRATAVENLAQVQLVRATFASDYMSNKLTEKIEINMHAEGDLWMAYTTIKFILNMFYLAALFCLLIVLALQINAGITTVASAMGLTTSYIHSTKNLVVLTRPLRRYMRGWAAVRDLFDFIPKFGKQGYPVIGKMMTPRQQVDEPITIEAPFISFDYETARLFNNHSFVLTCTDHYFNKLYGIIGPSGSGKTTLLSILGGQLKPIVGTVTINGVDIYAVTDDVRRQLIALQGQIATNLRGTIKYNLLFGLPKDHTYDDDYLLGLITRVGLLDVLSVHQGLDTMLGEGGLNLSGGQRQRLNFASLYLRARYYKPVLILIDEPTSSLDEVSEAAITDMIIELSHSAVTLVIAHRLKTVEKAEGLIDLSLLNEEKEIGIYAPAELVKRSPYYRALVEGKVPFDR